MFRAAARDCRKGLPQGTAARGSRKGLPQGTAARGSRKGRRKGSRKGLPQGAAARDCPYLVEMMIMAIFYANNTHTLAGITKHENCVEMTEY
ncbi:MAG: hypothetical protein HQK66_03705 [Desulfamplus sp.]|nr:hypothetical protein [Desulfamplus sp.]